MSTPGLPPDVDKFMDYIGQNVKLSGCLAWEEKAKIKADMMNVRTRWEISRVSPDALRKKCLEIDLKDSETRDVMDWLGKVQQGRQLRPNPRYRDFKWHQEPAT
ncbi:hypothetical protein ACOZE3_24170 [Streptomyces cinereoruber]|uniref:hypothetical protein n=1 Tax=Streptomyces cinereoruber TaxID=67260 RepID=UPI003BF57B8E